LRCFRKRGARQEQKPDPATRGLPAGLVVPPARGQASLGSRRNSEARRKHLLEFDDSETEVAKLRGPVGLNLGGKTPPEIAMSVVAEMTAVRRGVYLRGPLADWSRSETACRVSV
jgi:xanthine dehydrogenase accessory factor